MHSANTSLIRNIRIFWSRSWNKQQTRPWETWDASNSSRRFLYSDSVEALLTFPVYLQSVTHWAGVLFVVSGTNGFQPNSNVRYCPDDRVVCKWNLLRLMCSCRTSRVCPAAQRGSDAHTGRNDGVKLRQQMLPRHSLSSVMLSVNAGTSWGDVHSRTLHLASEHVT